MLKLANKYPRQECRVYEQYEKPIVQDEDT